MPCELFSSDHSLEFTQVPLNRTLDSSSPVYMLPLKGLETSLADMDNNHGICAPGAACYFPRIAGIVPEALLIQPGAAWYTPCCLTSSKVTGVPWRKRIFDISTGHSLPWPRTGMQLQIKQTRALTLWNLPSYGGDGPENTT